MISGSYVQVCNKKMSSRLIQGITLIELVITLAVLAVLIGLALPNFRDFLMTSNTRSIANELVGDMNFARAEAVKQGATINIVSVGNNWWSGGWQVQLPAPNNTVNVLRTRPAVPAGYSLKPLIANGANSNATTVSFNARGAIPGLGNNAMFFIVCRPDNNVNRSTLVSVLPSGQVSARRNQNAAGFTAACP